MLLVEKLAIYEVAVSLDRCVLGVDDTPVMIMSI